MFRAAITASIISIIVLGSYPTLTDAASQSTTQLQITSPASNAIVHPGQTLAITVVSPSNTGFSNVAVIGEDPIGFSNVANSLPAQVSLAIPANIACRRYMLTAVGSTSSGQNAQSPTILIDVERPDMPSALSTSISGISFQVIGEKGPMILLATFQDGSTLDVTESSNVAYASSNASVANIDPNGIVTAVAPGSASITATYTLATQQGTQTIQVAIPVVVPSQILAPSAISLSFGNQNVGTTSASQQLTLTNNRSGSLRVLSLSTTGDFTQGNNCISSSPLPAAGTCTVNVAFTPTAAGPRTGGLTIANGANIIPAVIPLSGTGIAASPSISSLNPSSGALGTAVTVTGTNFGSTQGSSSVAFHGTAANPTSWNNTSILTRVPTGATTGNVVVTVGGTASNGVNFTVQGTTNGISFVQSEGLDVASSNSSSLPFDSANAAGNFIAVCIRGGRSGETFTVSDTRGNTYHQAVQLNDTLDAPNGNTLAIFYTENISAGANTVTVSDTITATLRIAILEYTGVATANSLDVTVAAQGSNTSPNSGNVTTSASGELLLGAVVTADAASYTAGSQFVIRTHVPSEPNTKLIAEDQIQAAAGTAAATASLGASDPWGAVLATFKRAVAP